MFVKYATILLSMKNPTKKELTESIIDILINDGDLSAHEALEMARNKELLERFKLLIEFSFNIDYHLLCKALEYETDTLRKWFKFCRKIKFRTTIGLMKFITTEI